MTKAEADQMLLSTYGITPDTPMEEVLARVGAKPAASAPLAGGPNERAARAMDRMVALGTTTRRPAPAASGTLTLERLRRENPALYEACLEEGRKWGRQVAAYEAEARAHVARIRNEVRARDEFVKRALAKLRTMN